MEMLPLASVVYLHCTSAMATLLQCLSQTQKASEVEERVPLDRTKVQTPQDVTPNCAETPKVFQEHKPSEYQSTTQTETIHGESLPMTSVLFSL